MTQTLVLKIRRLPLTDCNVGFGVQWPSGDIVQYFVPHPVILEMKHRYPQLELFELARKVLGTYLKRLKGPYVLKDMPGATFPDSLDVREIPVDLLLMPETLRALKRVKSTTTMYQETVACSWLKRVSVDLFNGFADMVNPLLFKFHALVHGDTEYNFFRFHLSYMNFPALKIYPALNLAIQCEEADLEIALNCLLDDLEVLNQAGALRGHFMMPSIIELANTTGYPGKVLGVFAMPVVDQEKVGDIYAEGNPLDLQTVCIEGDLQNLPGRHDPYSQWVMDRIDIGPTFEDGHRKVQDGWRKTVKEVNSRRRRFHKSTKK